MLKFNTILFRNVFSQFGTPYNISKRVSMGHNTLTRAMESGDVRVSLLVELCNLFHLDIGKFFYEGRNPELINVRVPDKCWVPAEFHPESLRNYSRMGEVIKCSDLVMHIIQGNNVLSDVLVQDIDYGSAENSARSSDGGFVYVDSLLRALPSMLGIQRMELGRSIGTTVNLYARCAKQGDIVVTTLIRLCNKHHIPVSLFFQKDGEVFIPSEICNPRLEKQAFHPSRMKELYGSGTNYTHATFREEIGYTTPRLIRASSTSSPLTACELVRICNLMHVSPMFFFESNAEHSGNQEIVSLEALNRNLEERVRRDSAEKNRMQSEIEHLRSLLKMSK